VFFFLPPAGRSRRARLFPVGGAPLHQLRRSPPSFSHSARQTGSEAPGALAPVCPAVVFLSRSWSRYSPARAYAAASAFALRSEASILRVTRKIHVSHSESTLFARRIVFSPTIPISATPEFITSGVSLDWRVRIEFVTPRLVGDYGEQSYAELLEEISSDDRGMVLAAAEVLDCESFEIAVPLRVYGALGGNTEREENLVEGLAV